MSHTSFNWIDLLFLLATLASLIRGWRAGFLVSIFSAVGFIGGGLAGLYIGLHYAQSWRAGVGKFGLLLILISVGSWLGESLLKFIAGTIHKRILLGPFKWLDSLVGAAFSVLRTLVVLMIVAHLLLITPWSWANKEIPASTIYTKVNAYSPSIISQITKRASSVR